jgi:hypothetical protein
MLTSVLDNGCVGESRQLTGWGHEGIAVCFTTLPSSLSKIQGDVLIILPASKWRLGELVAGCLGSKAFDALVQWFGRCSRLLFVDCILLVGPGSKHIQVIGICLFYAVSSVGHGVGRCLVKYKECMSSAKTLFIVH